MSTEIEDDEFEWIRDEIYILRCRVCRLIDLCSKYVESANDKDAQDTINMDCIAYFECMSVQLRALGVLSGPDEKESNNDKTPTSRNRNEKNSYLLMHLLKKSTGKNDKSLWDDFCEATEKLEFPVRDMINILGNRYICHYDKRGKKIDGTKLTYSEITNKLLINQRFTKFVSMVYEYFDRYCDENGLLTDPPTYDGKEP